MIITINQITTTIAKPYETNPNKRANIIHSVALEISLYIENRKINNFDNDSFKLSFFTPSNIAEITRMELENTKLFNQFIPFILDNEFDKNLIQYKIRSSSDSKYISFFYKENKIMSAKIFCSNGGVVIDDNQMINELINNFYLITK